ncbi:zinc finger domain-containing protein [Gordonia sp. DT101]|uniref:zinc finger domain-containing protein n=1 Tax=Gordonia sp. DT101 TaxID=3416545 RepID=UPI003CED8425
MTRRNYTYIRFPGYGRRTREPIDPDNLPDGPLGVSCTAPQCGAGPGQPCDTPHAQMHWARAYRWAGMRRNPTRYRFL